MRDIFRSEEHCDTFISLGLKPEYFGTHLIRKEAITHAACGLTVSPPIASICIRANWKMPWWWQWLESNLHPESEVRGCIFWNETVPFANDITTRHLWDKTADTPSFTGLPPDVLYMSQLKSLIAKFDELKECLLSDNMATKNEIIASIETSLDNRAVGGEGYGHLREIYEMLETLLQRADAPVPPPPQVPDVTADELVEFNCQADDEDEEAVVDITFEEGTGGIHQANQATQSAHLASKRQMKKRKMSVGFHHGVLTTLPRSMMDYPQMSFQQLMSMWLMGSSAEGITALRLLNSKMVRHFDKEGVKLSRMRRLMGTLQRFAVFGGLLRQKIIGMVQQSLGCGMEFGLT
ncbi:hypothetical protein ACHAWO_007240 [Cyclotella atomus]|uniref:Uncharacterized protein n=1 Tax=Cyclotella atomus TaxID=382360 RepID=A0ABD3N776_9STRA